MNIPLRFWPLFRLFAGPVLVRAWWHVLSGDRSRTITIRPAGRPAATVWLGCPWVKWVAICYGRHVFFAAPQVSGEMLAHEYAHTEQIAAIRWPWGLRLLVYLWRWCAATAAMSYLVNPYEAGAFAVQARYKLRNPDRMYGPGETWTPLEGVTK